MKLNYLYKDDDYQVIWFHDSFDFFPSLLRMIDRRTYLIYSFSWYVSPERMERILKTIGSVLSESAPQYVTPKQIMFLMNSASEWDTGLNANESHLISFVNNACFLDPEIYSIDPNAQKQFSAVCNSKPLVFKRHWLSKNICSKVFITYEVNEPDYGMTKVVDLNALAPERVYVNVSPQEVKSILNRCSMGLILSEEEGACYASTEYLLCGLPVISTKSRGGRSEYYTADNSLIVKPDPALVSEAAERMLKMINMGAVKSDVVREQTVRRMLDFRVTFVSDLSKLLLAETNRECVVSRVEGLLPKHSKMLNYRNFFVK